MNANINEMLGKVTEFLKSEAKTETIIGAQFQLGEFSCVPVMSVGLGFGSAGGEGKGKGNAGKEAPEGEGEGEANAAGGGMNIEPVGFLVSRGDQIQFITSRSAKGLGAAFEKLPDLIDKFMNKEKVAHA